MRLRTAGRAATTLRRQDLEVKQKPLPRARRDDETEPDVEDSRRHRA